MEEDSAADGTASAGEKTPQQAEQGESLEGAPFPPDTVDPDLVRLGRSRRKRRPLLALVILVFILSLGWRTRSDLFYSFKDETAAALPLSGKVVENRFVSVPRNVDYASAVRVGRGTAGGGRRLLPLLGTSGRVWLLTTVGAWDRQAPAGRAALGRVRLLDDMPFAEALQARTRKFPRATSPEALAAAVAGKPLALANRDAVDWSTVGAVSFERHYPKQSELTALFTGAMVNRQTWDEILALMKVKVISAKEARGQVVYIIDETPATLESLLAQAERKEGIVAGRKAFITTSADALSASEKGLKWEDGEAAVENIHNVFVKVPQPVAANAMVVIEDERPGDLSYLKWISLGLGLIALLIVAYLVSALRARKED